MGKEDASWKDKTECPKGAKQTWKNSFLLSILKVDSDVCFLIFFHWFFLREEEEEGEREKQTLMWELYIHQLPFAHPLLRIKPATWTYALTGNRTNHLLVQGMKHYQLSHTSQSDTDVPMKDVQEIATVVVPKHFQEKT